MVSLARNGWTDEQILSALQGRSGSREVQFRYDVIRNGAKLREITATGSVSLNRFADIQRTGRFMIYDELDWLKDEIKPYMLLRMEDGVESAMAIALTCDERDALQYTCAEWDALEMTCSQLDMGEFGTSGFTKRYAEFPLGVFVLSTPTRKSKGALNTWEIEAYDRTVILQEDSLTEPLYFAAGTAYLSAVQSVLVSAGVSDVFVMDYVGTALPAARQFDIGLKKLAVANAMLSEINFNPVHCDADGRFILSAYKESSVSDINLTYQADSLSLIARDTSSETDFYNVPNVFIAVCSNPDLNTDYVSVWVNDSPVSRLSTVQRGRRIVSEIYRPDAIASQAELDNYIARIAFEANQVYEQLTFSTALMPVHGSSEVLEIKHPDIEGVFVESSWELPLSADGQMAHTARRLVLI